MRCLNLILGDIAVDNQKHLYELTRDLAEDWSNNAEKHVKEKVESTLNKRLEELILVLCGFEKEVSRSMYGWKVDHCNNRSGNSPIGQIINEALKGRLESINKSVQITPEEESDIKNEFRKEYIKSYRAQMIQQARHLGKNHADDYSEKTINSALEGAAESVRLMLMENK